MRKAFAAIGVEAMPIAGLATIVDGLSNPMNVALSGRTNGASER